MPVSDGNKNFLSTSKKVIKMSLLQAKLFQMIGHKEVTAGVKKKLIGNTFLKFNSGPQVF